MRMEKVVILILALSVGISCTFSFDDLIIDSFERYLNGAQEANMKPPLPLRVRTTMVHASENTSNDGFVIAEDIAPIINGDIEQAKNMAINGAMRRALETKGVNLIGETLVSHGLTIADSTWVMAEGFIKAWELVESGVVEGGGYRAKVKCWVKTGKARKQEETNLLSFMKVLFIADNAAEKAVEQELTKELRNTLMSGTLKQLRSHDSEFVKNNVNPTVWRQLTDRKLYDLDPGAYQFESNEPKPCLVIHIQSRVFDDGFSNTLNLEKFSAEAQVRLFQLSGDRKGEAIVETAIDSDRLYVKSSGSQERMIRQLLTTEHPNGFYKKIAQPLSAAFMEQVIKCKQFAIPDRTVTVIIYDVPSPAEYENFLFVVKNQRGVNGRVKQVSQDGSTYTLDVHFPMKSIYLANLISQNDQYEKIGHGWNRIEFQYRKTDRKTDG